MSTASAASPSAHDIASNPPGLAELPAAPIVIPHEGGEQFDRNGFGIHWKIEGDQTARRFSVVHHPLAPRVLAAPLHRHHLEDEYSYVLTGSLGALLGDDVITAGPGTWLFKPRMQWHSFWNAGDTPCEIIEIISPAGFENFFRGLAEAGPDQTKFAELARKFEVDMQPDSIPVLCERFGLRF